MELEEFHGVERSQPHERAGDEEYEGAELEGEEWNTKSSGRLSAKSDQSQRGARKWEGRRREVKASRSLAREAARERHGFLRGMPRSKATAMI